VQVGHHASRRFVGDLDGHFEDALWDRVRLARRRRLSAHVDAVARMALHAVLFNLLLKSRQPPRHQMNVLHTVRESHVVQSVPGAAQHDDKQFVTQHFQTNLKTHLFTQPATVNITRSCYDVFL